MIGTSDIVVDKLMLCYFNELNLRLQVYECLNLFL